MPLHKKHQHFPLVNFKSFTKLSPFERFVTVVGSVEPIASMQQVIRIYQLKSAEELTLFSWTFGTFATILWLVYAIKKRSGPLMVASFLWLSIYIPIVIAIIKYG